MAESIGALNPHQPALQQTQTVKQTEASDTNQAQDPNSGSRTKEILDDAIRQHAVDEAAKRQERGQLLNVRA